MQGAKTDVLLHLFCSVLGNFPLLWDSNTVKSAAAPACAHSPARSPQAMPDLVTVTGPDLPHGLSHHPEPCHSSYCPWATSGNFRELNFVSHTKTASVKHCWGHGRVAKEFCHNAVLPTRNKVGPRWYSIQPCPVQATPLVSPIFWYWREIRGGTELSWWNADILTAHIVKPYHTRKEVDTWVCCFLWICMYVVLLLLVLVLTLYLIFKDVMDLQVLLLVKPQCCFWPI